MKWRNTTGDAILDAAIRNAHHEKSDRLSVGDLCQPPRKVLLERRNETAPATADHVQGLIQVSFQNALGVPLQEAEHNGQTVAGTFIVRKEVLTVYKHPSTHARTRYFKALEEQPKTKAWDSYHPWILELNLKAHIARLNGIKFDRLEIRAVYTDWRRALAERDPHGGGLREGPAGYPRQPTESLAVEMLPREQAKDFFNFRVNLYRHSAKLPDQALQLCTARERWEKPEKWEAWADGGERSSYTAETEREALLRIAGFTTGKNYEVRHVPARPVRCLHHCMAAPFCNQYLEGKT